MNRGTGRARGLACVLALGLLLPAMVAATLSGGVWMRVARGVEPGVHVEGHGLQGEVVNAGGWTVPEVEAWVEKLVSAGFRPPVPARVGPPTGGVWVDIPGLQVDAGALVRALMGSGAHALVRVPTVPMASHLGGHHLEALTSEIGGFSTWGVGGGSRNHNLYLGAVLIDWTLLLPGDEFSFWEQVGPPTGERGFLPAPVIVGQSVVNMPGGGLCQVSTTLFNAALASGMEIVERHHHTMPVGYVGPGMDATVAWDYLDLRFRNAAPWPVIVRMGYAGGLLWARILGPGGAGD